MASSSLIKAVQDLLVEIQSGPDSKPTMKQLWLCGAVHRELEEEAWAAKRAQEEREAARAGIERPPLSWDDTWPIA